MEREPGAPLRRPKWERFAQEYLIDLDAIEAARQAGYSQKWASSNAYKLLRNTEIAERIQELKEERRKRVGIEADRVLQEIARVAFSDPRKFFNSRGSLTPIQEMDEDEARAIAGFDVVTIGNEEVGLGEVRKIKLWNKVEALRDLAKHLGITPETLNLNVSGNGGGVLIVLPDNGRD